MELLFYSKSKLKISFPINPPLLNVQRVGKHYSMKGDIIDADRSLHLFWMQKEKLE